ncbi:hypothetical protein WA026_022073 [Henosepilachna vigintioctopunctata]|uniref:Uncharacterized protein n=1 Tax=Henosepilachna vigintioctopunctata TaxID=420089 RepID=A0AAW1UCU9_9CUCU
MNYKSLDKKLQERKTESTGRKRKKPWINRREPQPGGSANNPEVSQQPRVEVNPEGGPAEAVLEFRCPNCEKSFVTR